MNKEEHQVDYTEAAREKAWELVNEFKDYVHGYIGSSMLSNYEYPHRIISQAKAVALIEVGDIIEQWEYIDTFLADLGGKLNPNLGFWYAVKKELEAIK